MVSRETLHYISPQDVNRETVKNLPEGVTLLSNAPGLAAKLHNRFVSLTTNDDYFQGREDSIHGVHFADMEIFHNGNTSPTTQPIAIKPVFSPGGAVREYKASGYLNRCDQLTFRHLGFIRWGGNFNTITEFDQGVVSYDNVLLNREYRPDEQSIAEALTVAANTLILLNDRNLVHGDFQVKNTASDVTGATRIIDVTTLRKFSDAEDICEDMSVYIESLTRFGEKTSPVSPQQVDEYLLRPYIEAIPDIFPIQSKLEVEMTVRALRDTLDFMLGPYQFSE